MSRTVSRSHKWTNLIAEYNGVWAKARSFSAAISAIFPRFEHLRNRSKYDSFAVRFEKWNYMILEVFKMRMFLVILLLQILQPISVWPNRIMFLESWIKKKASAGDRTQDLPKPNRTKISNVEWAMILELRKWSTLAIGYARARAFWGAQNACHSAI